jgi:hypothetical protein
VIGQCNACCCHSKSLLSKSLTPVLAAAAAVRQYFKLPGEHVSLIQCDMAERMSSAIGQWLETVKVRQGRGGCGCVL